MKGIIPDYFRKIADYAGISYEFLTPATRDEYIAYQKNKETTDISIDARLETDNYAETKKWGITAPFITMQLARVTRRNFDGKINVVTTVDQTASNSIEEGTTFTVDIPLEITDKECNKSDTGISEKVNLTGVNVLLAEDNELNAEIAAVQLEEFGMNVERAVDGKNAVEIFRNHPEGTFDVILMDIMMPEMNGYEAAKAIRAMNDRPDEKNIPIIAMTANSFAEDVQASLDAGMNAHLSKPIVIDEVIKTIIRYVYN